MSEATNLPQGGSDSATPSNELDNPYNLDFEEPELEEAEATQATEQTGTETDSETDAAPEDGQESDETAADDGETETEAGEAEAKPTEVKDDVVVDVNGEKLPLSELKAGYMKSADYTRKTQELGNKRRDLEALSTRVTNSVNAITELLISQIPPAPDPALAMTDPAKYVADKAAHDAMMAKVASVIDQANAPKEAVNKLTQEQRAELLQSENAKLTEAFPQTTNPDGRKKFFDNVMNVAQELGYSQQDIESVTDHRLLKLAHYAKLGMDAEKAKSKVAKKVENVPPVAKRKPAGSDAAKLKANQEAVKRLAKTGSIEDAMSIDFD